MAHSYTPGLTVSETTVLRKKRLLPIPGTVTAQVGDLVQADSVVAQTKLAGKVHVVNVANLLGVAPDEIREYLVKKEGETIGLDEVLAENKPFIKWFKTEVRSPIQGKVESLSTVTGQMLLREPPRSLDLLAYVDGVVVEVHVRQGVTVETDCSFVQGIFGIGGETWGPLVLAVKRPEEPLTPDRLDSTMKGKVVIAGSFLGADVMARAKEIGVAGLVVGGIHDKDLRALLGYDLGVAITGTERVGFSLIVTEGFGVIPMAAKTFGLLSAHVGQKACMSGATQIRAGVIRPEIIIPRSSSISSPPLRGRGAGEGAGEGERAGLRAGDQVRIIRDPLFGKIGLVRSLPSDLRQIETESHVRVLEVEFPDSTTAVIPRANVELIEG
ncbi:MAG: hypothetical protein FJ249_03350 [Nitrospira sp.]|nr:hypothetical protein [Nitrospira sp.]